MEYYVYILQSGIDQSFYIGYTQNIPKRLAEHNAGKSHYTTRKIPWKLVYQESFNSKTEALIRERFLKNQKNKEFYTRLISSKKD